MTQIEPSLLSVIRWRVTRYIELVNDLVYVLSVALTSVNGKFKVWYVLQARVCFDFGAKELRVSLQEYQRIFLTVIRNCGDEYGGTSIIGSNTHVSNRDQWVTVSFLANERRGCCSEYFSDSVVAVRHG